MTDKNELEPITSNSEEVVYSPSDVCSQLEIKDSTLRKYVDVLHKEGYEVQRNSKGHRVYSPHDVMVLERFMELSKHDGMTLEKAAKIVVVNEESSEAVTNEQGSYGVMVDLLLTEQRKVIQELEQRLEERLNQRDAMLMQSIRDTQEVKKLLLEVREQQAVALLSNEEKETKPKWYEFWRRKK